MDGVRAHEPAMIKVTIHPLRDPLRPQKDEIEFHESYASTEENYLRGESASCTSLATASRQGHTKLRESSANRVTNDTYLFAAADGVDMAPSDSAPVGRR